MPDNVALIGFMASGKSTVARILSGMTGMELVDTDEAVERSSSMTVSEIFSKGGEPLFRQLEREAVRGALARSSCVIALGGGAVLDSANRDAIRENCTVYLLEVSAGEALRRSDSPRPLLSGLEDAERLLADRRECYLDTADSIVSTEGRSPEEVAGVIADDYAVRSLGVEAGVVHVDLGRRSYPVFIGRGLIDAAGRLIERLSGGKAFVITEETVGALYSRRLQEALEKSGLEVSVLDFPGGEASKSLGTAEDLVKRAIEAGANRSDIVVALGGGVPGDLGGFVASILKRGLGLVQVPTTLMAQVDSSIGGKTGVNLELGKNLVGTFHQPAAVISDVELLGSLDLRQLRSGMAEVAKYSFLEPGGWPELGLLVSEEGVDPEPMRQTVARCADIKARVVAEDEMDSGLRAVLNYGHTLGHALEAASAYSGQYTHGEAVSVGMVFAATVAEEIGMARSLQAAHASVLTSIGLPVAPVEPAPSFEQVMPLVARDKKSTGDVTMVLLEDEGLPVVMGGIEEGILRVAYSRLRRGAQ